MSKNNGKGCLVAEQVLRIKHKELKTIRVVCKQCKTAVETTVATFDRRQDQQKRYREVTCPGCGIVLRMAGDRDHAPLADALDHLVVAWEALAAIGGNFEVLFVVPAKEADAEDQD